MKLILIDGNSLMYRAYYATAYTGNLMQNTKGIYTNAVFGFANMIEKIMSEPFDYMLVAFDKGKITFRHEINPEYKDGRTPMPDEMRMQIPLIKELIDKMGIKRYELDLYEADDIIGTMSKIAEEKGIDVEIYSSDKDLFQLISDKVMVHSPKKGVSEMENYTPSEVFERYGLAPNQMIDLKALMGDPSDNLKGISGVGEKTAIKLLKEFNTLENIIDNVDLIKGKMKDKIKDSYNDALICKKMVTINRTSPIEITLDDTLYKGLNNKELVEFYKEMEFHSLLKRLKSTITYEKIDSVIPKIEELKDILIGDAYIYLENFDENYHKDSLIGLGIVNEKGNFFIPKDYLSNDDLISYLENENIKKYTFDCKKMYITLKHNGIIFRGVIFDLLLASYIINPENTKDELKVIASIYDYENLEYDSNIYGSGAKKMIPDINVYSNHIVSKAYSIKALYGKLIKILEEQEQLDLFYKIELPLAKVLANMEYSGIKVDLKELDRQKYDLGKRILEIEEKIYLEADAVFNISSTKQLGEILFEKLALPVIKKTKTGYSTESDVLEKLADKHNIIPLILEYRSLTKLYSTYIMGLYNQVYPDMKCHTIFKQALTNTGRLSSVEPNLQNIPIRTLEGREIRKIFVPSYDYLISFDYSQIELRILAHMANVTHLIDAFNENIDVHKSTAMRVFGKNEISADERRKAKAVNFGIIYGISAYGLAEDIKITTREAKEFIDKYHEAYPEIKPFMDLMIENASDYGYVKTIMNRRRYIKEINSNVYLQKEFGKRTAMNAPIQGSAADIIKLAMINVYEKMKEMKLKSKMIIQVHDELIFDCKKEELDALIMLVKEEMENVIKLRVPLTVDYNYGKTWYEAK